MEVYVVVRTGIGWGESSIEGVFKTLDLARKSILKRMVECGVDKEAFWLEKVPIVDKEDDIHIGDTSDEALIEDAMAWSDTEEEAREWVEKSKRVALNMQPK